MPLIPKPSISIADLIVEYLKDEKEHLPDGTSSYDAYESLLIRNSAAINGIDALNLAGIHYVEDITRQRLKRTSEQLKEHLLSKSDRSGVATAIRQALIWGIENRSHYGFKCNTKDVKDWLKMPSKKADKILQISDEELYKLKKSRLGDSDIEHFQNRLMVIVLGLGHGIRSGSEVTKLKDKNFNPTLMELTIHRKGETDQVVPLRKNDTRDMIIWIKMKHNYIKKYGKKRDVKSVNADSLFIKINPNVSKNQLDWALPPGGPNIIFKKLREMLNIEKNKRFGTLRHTSCTMQQQNAMALGYHEKYAATLNAHSEQTERDYYVSTLGPEVEILSRFPEENIDLCESIFADAINEFSKKPSETRHLACAMTSLEVMGRLQFREVLNNYRKGKNDLETISSQHIDLKKLRQRLDKLF